MATKNTMSDRNLVTKGTSSDDTPTPGFVLKELVNSTWGGAKQCKDIVGLLVPRVKKSDPNVKLKALKIINYLIVNGCVEFQREMRPNHQIVRDCINFTGPLDPLKGDAVYVAIHAIAKETVDNLFNETLLNRNAMQRPVDSFAGAAVSSQAPVTGLGGGSRAPPAPKDDWLNRAKGTFGSAGAPPAPAPAQPAAPQQPPMTGRYGAPAPTAQPAAPAGPFGAPAAPAQPAQPAAPAPAAQPAPAKTGGLFKRKAAAPAAPAVPAAPVYTPPVIKAGSAVTDGSYERKLVEELCTPQGMRPEPPKDKLTRFAVACQTLDASVVGPIILAKLSDKNWKVVMKALYTIQEILKTPNTDGFKLYFKENTEELQMLGNYNHPMVKKLGAEVYDRVTRCGMGDAAEEEEEPAVPIAAAPVAVAPAGDFDFFGATPAPAPAPVAAPAPAAPAANDPFGFSNVSSIDDAFSFAKPAAPAAAPVAAAPVANDPFGAGVTDINNAFSNLAPAAPAPAPAPAAPAQPAGFDFFSAPAAPAPAAPAAPAQPAGFDFFSSPAPAPAAPQQPAGFGMAPQQPAGFGMAPQQPAYGMAPQQPAYGMAPQQPAYGMAPQQPAPQQPAAMDFNFFGM